MSAAEACKLDPVREGWWNPLSQAVMPCRANKAALGWTAMCLHVILPGRLRKSLDLILWSQTPDQHIHSIHQVQMTAGV